MKKIITALVIMGVITGLPIAAQASPYSDLKAFRAFFKKKFPTVRMSEWTHGMYALPGAKRQRAEWEEIMVFPPFELSVVAGKKFWDKNNLGTCFKNKGRGIAHAYPRWDNKKKEVVTAVMDINKCLKSKGKKPIKNLKKGKMAQVVAYFRSMANGKKVQIDMSNPGMVAEYERGKKFYWARRGQLNFSCATCHVQNAGKHVGGNILGAGIGHGTGFPVYRSKWGGLGTLHRRYGGCNKQVRAKPLKAQSRDYRALEVYETYMATGIPIRVPSQRF
jgi:sulfur-oxidizing protein SoxA